MVVSFTRHNYFETHPSYCTISLIHSFLLLSIIPVYEFYLSIHSLMESAFSQLLNITNKATMTICTSRFLGGVCCLYWIFMENPE